MDAALLDECLDVVEHDATVALVVSAWQLKGSLDDRQVHVSFLFGNCSILDVGEHIISCVSKIDVTIGVLVQVEAHGFGEL